jgi:hypothetical protein
LGSSWITRLGADIGLTIATPDVWQAIAQALLIATLLTAVGIWVGRHTGLIATGTGTGAALGVGLALGVCVATPVWAAIDSGGRSAFTPVALTYGFAMLAMLAQRRKGRVVDADADRDPRQHARWLLPAVIAAISLVAAALIYGAALAPRARDGVQPVEFMDDAFYSVLARDLDQTGAESFYAPSGFEAIPGTPSQSWYHWGEMWLAAGVSEAFGTTPLDARHLVALPILLLAAIGTAGALVQAFGRTRSRGAFLWGCLGTLFLLPVPWLLPGYQAHWEFGLVIGITSYGLAAVAAILLLYAVTLAPVGRWDRPRVLVVAGTAGLLVPAHILVFLLACVGVVAGALALVWAGGRGRVLAHVPPGVMRVVVASAVAAGLALAWGSATGHGLAANDASVGAVPFGEPWREATLATLVGAGVLLCVPLVWWVLRREDPYRAAIAAGTTAIMLAAIVVWGARFPEHNMFHVFTGAIAVFVTPVAIACVWLLWDRTRASGRRALAATLVAVCLLQVGLSGVISLVRLERRGSGDYPATPISMLEAIRSLPADARIAYACQPRLEVAFWEPWLLSLDAHTGRRMVLMCFVPDSLGVRVGAPEDPTAMSPFFAFAPQRSLYPTAEATPSPDEVAVFLAAHGIGYLYQDAIHSATLVPWAVEVFRDGDHRLLRIP